MTKRRLIVGLPLLALALFGAFLVVGPSAAPRISVKNYERIQGGMTPADVNAILGPPGDYSTRPRDMDIERFVTDFRIFDAKAFEEGMKAKHGGPDSRQWRNDRLTIVVFFGPTDRVVAMLHDPTGTADLGPFGNFRRGIEKVWHRWFP